MIPGCDDSCGSSSSCSSVRVGFFFVRLLHGKPRISLVISFDTRKRWFQNFEHVFRRVTFAKALAAVCDLFHEGEQSGLNNSFGF